MRELAEVSQEAAPGLVLEFCKGQEGHAHELIVSVDGKSELVDAAIRVTFVDEAIRQAVRGCCSCSAGWNVVAFRPRDKIAGSRKIDLEGERLGADDIWFRVTDSYLAVRELEERLTEVLQQGQQSLLTMSIMAAGRRELILYTANAEAALQRLDGFRADGVSHELKAEVQRDTFWGLYLNFCQSCSSAESDEG
jgi:hypothetical protein